MAQTEHYGIRQWEAWEVPGHTDLNGALGTIDAALAALESGKLAGVFGSCTGTGTADRVISLGFTPACVVLTTSDGRLVIENTPYDVCGGIFFPAMDLANFKIVEGGFRISNEQNYGGSTNSSGVHYYIAFKMG